ncbi:AglZ/HisF2 family acetamidino modification protein [Daejeonella sp.]|uniref:AglZ/HisF2 family acetamidino modification protein n=1 Tax=Daejeonella sp. TaxID=2805397 RepID=UPI0027236F3F|nr:AglZ/HisF2 family acetamidino modification protein [Daejeonella sp.]MDO8994062.1 AglZ/HisF2 family acetamidino modification protein [Daejeonella sp.]MDP2414339.1 AglZ/HisF2 family acetamidino modification protein [Daejeonella sp.]
MLRIRVIPCLQLVEESLVKTIRFGDPGYIGDPINTVRIFNELEVDELCFLDIRATLEKRPPNFKILREIADECFMPLSYGGGVDDSETAKKILSIGFEKIILNTAAIENPFLVSEIANHSGNQSVLVSIDIKRNLWGNYQVYSHCGTKRQNHNPVDLAKTMEDFGAGELLVTSMDRDGTWTGYDIDILKKISDAVNIPVIANGGAGKLDHIDEIISKTNISAVALGSMVVYQKKGMGVLVNFPDRNLLEAALKI